MEVLFMYVQALQPWLIQRSREKNGELAKAYPHCIGNIWFMGAIRSGTTYSKRLAEEPSMQVATREHEQICSINSNITLYPLHWYSYGTQARAPEPSGIKTK